MKIERLSTEKLLKMGAPQNPRRISEHDLQALGRSLRTFGTVQPVVVNRRTNRVVGGHQRIQAAKAEGIDALPVVYVDLDDAGERQLNLALNRISGTWDEEALGAVLQELAAAGGDLELTGFDATELEKYLLDADGAAEEPAVPEPPADPVTRPGDLLRLGDHRLLCGDAGSKDDLARLLKGEPIHLVHTDPPYNVKVEPRSNNAIAAARAAGRHQKNKVKHHQGFDLARHKAKDKPTGPMRARDRELANDFVSDEAFAALLRAWFANLAAALLPGRTFYLWGGYSNIRNYPSAILEAGLYFSQTIIWHKQWPVLSRKDFMGDHEWCFYGWKQGGRHYFNPAIKNAADVWVVKKIAPPAMVHLTEKPVELAVRALTYSSRQGENVLDLFGGSGSTLMAAERLGRHAFLMEIDPAYCDVIVERWQQATGRKARRQRKAA